MNNITILGRFVKDPVIKKSRNNTPYVFFTLAAKQGKDKTNFIPCIAFANIASVIESNIKQGSRIFAEGYLETVYNDNGSSNIVKVRYIEFADSKVTLENPEKNENIEFTVNESFEIDDITDLFYVLHYVVYALLPVQAS